MAPRTDTLWRAWLFRSLGLIEAPGESLGITMPPPPYLAVTGTPSAPVIVLGRLYHSLQITGLSVSDSESLQLQASLDGITYANLGSAITASGFVQVTTGVYGYFKMNMGVAKPAFTFQYVGAGAVATLTIAGQRFTTTVDGVVDLDLDLTAAAYDTYTELVAYLDGLADYTANTPTAGGANASTSITEVSLIDIKTGTVALKRGATVTLASMR